jgi:hypothetical protein
MFGKGSSHYSFFSLLLVLPTNYDANILVFTLFSPTANHLPPSGSEQVSQPRETGD